MKGAYMTVRELSEKCGVEYDKHNPARTLERIKRKYEVTEIGFKNYELGRELSLDEQLNALTKTNARQMLRYIICSELAKAPDNIIRTDTKGFLELFYVVNYKYRYFAYDNLNKRKRQILKETDIPQVVLEQFYRDVHPLLNNMLKSIFKQLQSESLITKTDVLMYGKKVKLDNGNFVVTKHEMTHDDIEKYLNLRRAVSKELYHTTNFDRLSYYKQIAVQKEVCKRSDSWDFIYNDYLLCLNRKDLKEEAEISAVEFNKEIQKKVKISKQKDLKKYNRDLMKSCVDFLISVK